jgi:hypothetical protein
MRHLARSTALCSALVILAACDNSEAPLTPQPDAGSARTATAPSGLVAFYPFEQGPGNGTLVGTPAATTGYQGGAYFFNGVGAAIDLPVNVSPWVMPQVTMGAWARVASVPSGRQAQVLSHDNAPFDRSIGLDLRSLNGWSIVDGKHRFSAFTGSGVLSGPVVDLSRWVFLATVYSGGTVTLYVDGARYTTTGNPGTGTSLLRVGGNPAGSASGEFFHGSIDNVFVYNRALSEAEIATIRTGGACAIVTPCVGTPGAGVLREGLARITQLVASAGAAGQLQPAQARHVSRLIALATGYLDRADAANNPLRKAVMLRYVLVELDEALALLRGPGAARAAAYDETARVRALVQARLDAI